MSRTSYFQRIGRLKIPKNIYIRRFTSMNILTCVYCGVAFPEGTPPHGSVVLTDHIKTCEKHPLRAAEEKIKKLRKALTDMLGVSTRQELQATEAVLRPFPGALENDNVAVVNAIHALLETEEGTS
jgi:hypothetical protein